ncbi:MAG: NHL repeat-containing protein [Gammaproteobacteria bacterium]|nr:NHL repeat-containing protein [Gammaproteobacteria bacterium]MDH5777802.1 NHL repeat-containing protein [Gammaproteobacteria bacterium]
MKYAFAIIVTVFNLTTIPAIAENIKTHSIKHLFDIKGKSSSPLILPTDIAVQNDRVYVVDSGNHRIQVFDMDGDAEFIVGKEGIAKSEFRGPVGIDVDSDDRFYVADTGNHRVQVFDKGGKFLTAFDVTENDKLIRPVDVSVHEKEKLVYVSGNNNHRIMGFSISGHLKRAWGQDGVETGEFRYPATMTLLRKTRLAVVDVLNSRVQLFNPKGKEAFEVGGWGVLPGQLFRPKGIATDSNNFIYVSDSYMGVIQAFTDTGKFIAVMGDKGKPRVLQTPSGIAIDKNNRLYVAEMLSNKVSVWQIESYPAGAGK